MDGKVLKMLLEEVSRGGKSVEDALGELRTLPFADFSVCKHDTHRALRNGFSEVMLCEGKKTEHVVQIVKSLIEKKVNVFGTRVTPELGEVIVKEFGERRAVSAQAGESVPRIDYDPVSRTFCLIQNPVLPVSGKLAILCAGTADLPVAEEARKTAQYFGVEAQRFYDVGVAGLQRLLSCWNDFSKADCIIVVAGMEGALPSVMGGLVSCPIIAVPTSVGYGTHLNGFSALLTMLNSCSEGITVVNIDNGFGAACAALRILRAKTAPEEKTSGEGK